MNVKFIKVMRSVNPCAWWNYKRIIGKTFKALEISEFNYVKIEYKKGKFGWIPLNECEVNPHLKLVK